MLNPEPTDHAPPLVNAVDMAEVLGISRQHVTRLVRRGRLPKPQMIGKQYVWRAGEVDEAIRARRAETVSEGSR